MSHIHIPDGVLPVSWWLLGYLITGVFLFFAIKQIEKGDVRQKIPYLGVISAIMLITMSIPLGIIPFHINLTVFMGVLAGPALGFVAVFIVNLILSFLGHGGITTVGLNTLILGLEVALGSVLFGFLRRRIRILPAIGIVTAITLLISTMAMVGVVGLSQSGWEYAMPHSHHEELSVQEHNEGAEEILSEISFLGITGLGAIVGILLIGIGLEVVVTILLTRFFLKVRPDLIKG